MVQRGDQVSHRQIEMPEQKLVARLKDVAGVTALVAARIWPVYRPADTALPAIVYEVDQRLPINHATGTTGTTECNLSVYCIASTYAGAKALAAAVETALSGWADADGCVWHLDSQTESVSPPLTGRDVPEFFIVDQNYSVWD